MKEQEILSCGMMHLLLLITHIFFFVFYPSTEYQEISGDTVNVQAEIESPEMYIIGRCKSNDEQLGYIETRLECLKDLGVGVNLKTIDNQYEDVTINDRMRFLHGDGPAASFEAGNQKGGHYFCPSCDVHSSFTDNISYSYQLALHSLEDIRPMVLQENIGKERSMKKVTCPLENLNADDLRKELSKRKVDFKGNSTNVVSNVEVNFKR